MIPVYQRHRRGPSSGDDPPAGDCMAACLASLLELPLEDVPNFGDDRTPAVAAELDAEPVMGWWVAARRWARNLGADLACVADLADVEWTPGTEGHRFAIATVPSPRGRWHHVVIVNEEGLVVHDPYPGGREFVGRRLGADLDATEVWVLVAPYDPWPPVFPGVLEEAAGG